MLGLLSRSSRLTIILRRSPVVVSSSMLGKQTNLQIKSFQDLARRRYASVSSVNGYSSSISPPEKKKGKTKKKKVGVVDGKKKSDWASAESSSFYVVRKGDIVGVYNDFADFQPQLGSSICDPPVSVYKGYSLPKDTVEYLLSRGLKNALYSFTVADLKEQLFGALLPWPPLQVLEGTESKSLSHDPPGQHVTLDNQLEIKSVNPGLSCTLEFDGASKGNPGRAGAGVVLRTDDGNLICRLREGLGIATNNVAEYRAMILGLRYALEKGYTSIRVLGDSKLVCMQIQGLWRVRHKNISPWYQEAKTLKDKFLSFQITHVLRGLNKDADIQANLGAKLDDGQVEEESDVDFN